MSPKLMSGVDSIGCCWAHNVLCSSVSSMDNARVRVACSQDLQPEEQGWRIRWKALRLKRNETTPSRSVNTTRAGGVLS
eukprot:1126354-Pelagomonas_calceolata.AAC.1